MLHKGSGLNKARSGGNVTNSKYKEAQMAEIILREKIQIKKISQPISAKVMWVGERWVL